MKMSSHLLIVWLAVAALTGCATIEGGFRYEYDGRVMRADGKTPAKGVTPRPAGT